MISRRFLKTRPPIRCSARSKTSSSPTCDPGIQHLDADHRFSDRRQAAGKTFYRGSTFSPVDKMPLVEIIKGEKT